jgi:hypothetical protein
MKSDKCLIAHRKRRKLSSKDIKHTADEVMTSSAVHFDFRSIKLTVMIIYWQKLFFIGCDDG